MELLLELRVDDGRAGTRLDCRADVDPSGTVGELRRALVDHARARDVAVDPSTALWADDGRRLHDDHLVSSARLPTGGRVWLSPKPPRVRPPEVDDVVDSAGGVPFNRTPYRPAVVRPQALDPLPAPPASPTASRVAVTSFVVPLASGVGFAVVLGRAQFLLIALLAPVALVAVGQFEKRRGRRSFRAERAEFLEALDERVEAAGQAVEDERDVRHRALPALERLVEDARTRRPSLWGRGRDAPDLLQVRLGIGDDASAVQVSIGAGGDEELRRQAHDRLGDVTATVRDVPVPLDLEASPVVGLHGDPALVDALARSILGQLLASHGPEDLVVAALLAPPALRSFEWMRWLPHVRSSASPLPGDHLSVWPEAVADVLGSLLDLAAARAGRASAFPRVLAVVHEDAAIDRAALGRLLDGAGPAGIRVLWVGRDEALLPRQCATVVRVEEGEGRSVRSGTDPGTAPVSFTVDQADVATLDRLARHLAPLRDASSVARVGSIPRLVGLTDVLGGTPAPADVASAWSVSEGGVLDAPLGIGAGGVFGVDLVEHGPHTLVAGTSGAGKSELLQSWVAALAARHPPERLTFLFIDYKGGAAAAPFANLPHNVGVVTDLDSRMSRRALTSLRAELERRMALLAERDARDLSALAALDPSGCPARLVLVVDEFATLVKEIPDFVSGVVDIAQRGRSLGIHLILATQRPAGAVNENILANTNLRIALRVVDAADSQSIIGCADAADIPVPLRGRAFARMGPTELVPFQAAWSGAPRRSGDAGRVRVHALGFGSTPSTEAAVSEPARDGTQLDVVLAAIGHAFERSDRNRPRRPWLPPLPDVVALESLERFADDPGRVAVVGLHDDPARQRRGPAVVDLEAEGGLAVFGTGGSGRTTALRTAAASLVRGASTDDVQLVVFDFAGRTLVPLLELPHTRSVGTGDDLEAVAREIEWLSEEVVARRTLLGEERVESLGALRQRRREPVVPRLAVVIDGFGSLRAELDSPAGYDWLQRLQRLLVAGRQLGIHPLIAADRRADLPGPVLGSVGARLVLRMTEPDAMVSLGVPLGLARGDALQPGRGFLRGDEEVQVAVLGDDPSGAGQAEAVAALGQAAGSPPVDRPAPLPEQVRRPLGHDRGLSVGLGVDERGRPVVIDLSGGHLLVVGPPGSGRSTALEAIRVGLRAQGEGAVDGEGRVLVVDDADDLDDAEAGRVEALASAGGVTVVAAFDSATVARAFAGLVPALKRGRRMLLLRPESASEVDQLAGVRTRFRPGVTFPPGRGVLVVDRQPTLLQVGHGDA
jgi:S-DNA-T family DNA segregation ATPase FtsK/SpoIIIE